MTIDPEFSSRQTVLIHYNTLPRIYPYILNHISSVWNVIAFHMTQYDPLHLTFIMFSYDHYCHLTSWSGSLQFTFLCANVST